MTLDQFIAKYNGKRVEYHSYSTGALNQCVDLANAYITEVLGFPAIIGTNAQDFPKKAGSNYEWIANTPTGVPSKGDLMIFKSADNVGHISIFIDGDANLFRSFDQNFPTGSVCKYVSHNYKNVLGWLRPRKGNMATVAVETAVFEKLVQKSSAFDAFVNEGFSSVSVVKEVISKLQDQNLAEANKVKALEAQVAAKPEGLQVDMNKWELNGLQVIEGNYRYNFKLKE